jgi:hypothetical protein
MSDRTDFKAFEETGADRALRETLAGHRVEPTPALWKGISRKLLWSELLRFNFTNLSPKYWAAGAIAVLMIAAGIYTGSRFMAPEPGFAGNGGEKVLRDNPESNRPGQTATVQAVGLVGGNEVHTVAAVSSPTYRASAQEPAASGTTAAPLRIRRSTPVEDQDTGGFSVADVSAPEDTRQEVGSATEVNFSGPVDISRLQPYEALLTGLAVHEDTIITITSANGIYNIRKAGPASAPFFSASLGISPEISFYSSPDAYSKANFWLNGNIAYNFSRFSVVSGLGVGYVYDEGKYNVEYKSLDSVGYYTGVASYTVGANQEIIYNTKTISVYDSLYHLGDFRTKNRYTYIQIPLLFGYRFFETAGTSLSFRAGPAVSFLVATRKSDPVIEYENARIIRTDDNTPARVETNWQVWASLYFELRMNKQVSLYLEPSFKYYIKPMVEQENVSFKAPMTVGLGVGLQFNFGNKTVNP